jgi:cytochrome c
MHALSRSLTILFISCALLAPAYAGSAPQLLVFSKTAGFRHDSIAAGIQMLQAVAAQEGYVLQASEEASMFSPETLAGFDAVIWLSTTGDVLNTEQQAAFEGWMQQGGGYVGIHAAADCEYGWAWYGAEVLGNGAWFSSHPVIQAATVIRESADDASTAHLPPSFSFTDEWYNFAANPRPGARVLLRLDESSYAPGTGGMGADHPISWQRELGAGRVWYTGLGHRTETFADSRFIDHVRGGLAWVLRRDAGDAVFANGFEPSARGR